MLIAAAALAAFIGCGEKDYSELVVAKIDTREITVADFEKVAETIDESYLPATADLEGKKELLDHMINKEVMALKALAMGYEKEQWFVDLWNRYRGPFLVTQLMDHLVKKQVVVTEEEVADYFREMHFEYTLSQIVVANEDEAIEIRERILEGEDFAEMAKTYSLAPGAEEGGYVGANTVGRIHWWVEEELFDMEPGDISDVLKTSTGWAIIKLHRKRKVEPLFDEVWAERRVRAIKEKKGIVALKAKIEKDINLRFFPDAVNIAFDALPPDVPMKDIVSYKVTRKTAPMLNIPAESRDKLICQYDDGSYTLADFEEIYYRLSLPERPRRQYGRAHIIQTIHKVVFDKVLPVYAEQEAKVLEVPEIRDNLQEKKELFLVQKLYDDQIKDEVTVTMQDKRNYYAENMDKLLKMERRDFSVVLVSDEATANEVYENAALGGMDFTMLVRKFSVSDDVKDTLGRTGLHAEGAMQEYDVVGFSLDGPGSISKPFMTSRGWAVLKLEEVEDERAPTFEEAEATINKDLLEKKYEEHFQLKLEKWRQDYILEVYDSALEKAEITRTRA